MRQREIAIYDQRNSGTPLKRITLDVGSSALEPVCDYDRGIVYMVAKGESSVRWVDVGSEDQGGNFAEGAHALNFATTSAAIGPSIKCDTGVGEIAKLFIASTAGGSGGGASAVDTINPASIRVPRRTYIDFHSDLYPLTPVRHGSGLESAKWMQGDDASLPLLSLDPAARGQVKQNGSASHSSSQGLQPTSEPIAPSAAQPSVQPIAPSATQTPIQTFPAAAPPAATPKVTSQAKRAQESSTPSIPPPTTAQNTAERKMADQDKPAAPAVHWSRRFLAGSTPLIPSFQNLTSLDNSRAPAAKMVAASTDIFFVPLAGPGGRLGVHPLKREGRLPMQMPSFSHGAPLGDFAVDPFHQDQIITSAADGVIRLWKIPSLPGDGQDWPQNLAEQPLTAASLPTDQGSNKVAELCPHPHADGLVAVIPADVDGKIHLVDVRKGGIVKSIGVPAQGLYNAVWSPDGSVLAGAGKDRNLYILDVRGKSPIALTLGQAPAHDSPRPFSIVWINDRYLLTVGHTTGSLRQVKLFAIDDADLENSLTEVAKHNLDVSPSILFPYWDADVDVLWLWSKGERLISTFEVQPDNVKEPFLALTAFQHNHPQLGVAFMRKDCVNVREVEIASSVRLCKDEVQKVAWSITRSRPEYFQDDIYKPAVVIDKPLISIEEWKSGKDAQDIPRKSLQPEGMQPCECRENDERCCDPA
jgi:coronin-7